MKSPFFILCLSIFLLFFMAEEGEANGQIHIRRGFVEWGGGVREYQFFDVPENIGYFTEFPVERVKEKISPERWDACFIDYWIFPSIEDAELAVVERLETICLMHNFIDVPLPKGLIGNNCWHQIQVGEFLFIRNNIFVSVGPGRSDESTDISIIETVARQIDSVLIQTEKIHDPKRIPAPLIRKIEMISPFPNTWEEEVILKIDAIDPQGGKVNCRKYWDRVCNDFGR